MKFLFWRDRLVRAVVAVMLALDLGVGREAVGQIGPERAGDTSSENPPGEVFRFVKHNGPVRDVAISPDGQYFATLGDDRMCHVLDTKTFQVVRSYGPHFVALLGLAFLADRRLILAGARDADRKASVFFWNWQDREELRAWPGTDHDAFFLAVAPDESRVAVSAGGDVVRAYALPTLAETGVKSPGRCTCLAFSADSQTLVTGGREGARGWLLEGQQARAVTAARTPGSGAFLCLACMPVTGRVVSGHADRIARVADLSFENVFGKFEGHQGDITAIAFSPNEKLLVTGSSDRSVRVWYTESHQLLKQFSGHTAGLTKVAFFLGNRYVLSASLDGTVRLWSLADGAASAGDLTFLQARWFRDTDRFAQAVQAYQELYTSRERTLGGADPRTLELARALAETHRAAGNYDQAIATYSRCYQASEPELRSASPEVPQDLPDLARAHALAGDFSQAEQVLLKALAERTSRLGAEHAAVADTQFALGQLYQELHDAVAAQRCFEASLKIREAALPAQHSDIADSLLGLAESRFEQQSFNDLEALYRRVLAIREARFQRPDPRICEVDSALAEFYLKVGRVPEGRDLLETSMREASAAADSESRPAIVVRRRYGAMLQRSERFDAALKLLNRALYRAVRSLGPQDPEIPLLLAHLALCYDYFGAAEEAVQDYLRAVAIVERRYGVDSVQLSAYLNNLGFSYEHAGQAEQAEQVFRRSAEIQRKHATPQAFASAINLAGHLVRRGKAAEALEEFDRGLHELRALTARMLPVMQDAAQNYYLQQTYALLSVPLSAALERRDDDAFVERSAEWVLNLKELSVEAAAEQELTARDAQDSAAGTLARELAQVRQQLGALAPEQTRLASCAPTSPTLLALWRQERALAARLGEITQRRLLHDDWAALSEVRQRLARDQVLIETTAFAAYDFQRRRDGARHYVAWVIPAAGQGRVRLIDLGDTMEIQQAVFSFHRKLTATTHLLAHMPEADAVKPLDAAGRRLSTLLVAPLGQVAAERSRWLLSADAALWLVPWAALPTGNGKYLVEDHELTYVLSGRDLLKRRAGRSAAPPVIVADPDYDWGLPAGFSGDARFTPLPSTAAEAAALTPHLTKYTGQTPVTYSGAQALERTIKSLRRPSALVLSTHGYFRESLAPRETRSHPWLRCGVALAGANAAGTVPAAAGNDGILTGLEVLSMDLRGTDLVVLSACKTGLGDPTLGQGMSGLSQTFQLAGASSVVATRWSIPDLPSSFLVSSFFQHLAGGMRKSEALRAAQLEMIQDRRHEHQAAHPYYWAAFSITGSED